MVKRIILILATIFLISFVSATDINETTVDSNYGNFTNVTANWFNGSIDCSDIKNAGYDVCAGDGSGGNSSWNQTFADTLYFPISGSSNFTNLNITNTLWVGSGLLNGFTISSWITNAVSNLVNYFTKTEINSIIETNKTSIFSVADSNYTNLTSFIVSSLGGNSSWNQTRADELYASHSNLNNAISGNISSVNTDINSAISGNASNLTSFIVATDNNLTSYVNSQTGDNSTWNQTRANELYLLLSGTNANSNVNISPYLLISGGLNITGDSWFEGNLLPFTTLNYNLGSGSNRWNYLYIQNISSDYIDNAYDIVSIGNVTGAYFHGSGAYLSNLNISGDLTGYALNISFLTGHAGIGSVDMRGDPWYFSGSDFQIANNLIIGGDINVTGNIEATEFYGSGQFLTGITGGNSSWNQTRADELYASHSNLNSAVSGNISLINTDINSAVSGNATSTLTTAYATADSNYSNLTSFITSQSTDFSNITSFIVTADNNLTSWVVGLNYITNAVSDLVNYFTRSDVISMISGNISAVNTDLDGAISGNVSLINTDINSAISGNITLDGSLNSTAWNRSSTNVFLANGGDNVGIGTTSPTTDLEVYDTSGANLLINTYKNSPSNASLLFKSVVASSDVYRKAGLIFVNDGSGSGRGDLYFALSDDGDDSNVDTGDAVMTLLHEGNVGIGTTAPTQKLDVNGSVNLTGDWYFSHGGHIYDNGTVLILTHS